MLIISDSVISYEIKLVERCPNCGTKVEMFFQTPTMCDECGTLLRYPDDYENSSFDRIPVNENYYLIKIEC